MKVDINMRVLFRKIRSPFICFCKPSAARHLYSASPLKLDNNPHVVVPSTTEEDFDVHHVPEKSPFDEGVKVAENTLPKSCLRKFPNEPKSIKEDVKKNVKWIDASGGELAEIREFESSETVDTDTEDESSRCLCIII